MTKKKLALYSLLAFIVFVIQQIDLFSIMTAKNPLLPWLMTVLTAAVTLLFAKNYLKNDNTEFKLKWYQPIVWNLLILLATMIMNLIAINTKIYSEQSNQMLLEGALKNYIVIFIIMVTLLVPIIEETIFRGLIPEISTKVLKFCKIPEKISYYLGFLLGFIAFIGLHNPNGLYGWLSYGILAAGLTIIRIHYKTIKASILAHMSWNALVSILMIFLTK